MIEREMYNAIGITTGTRLHMLVLVCGQDWLVVSEYRESGRRPSVDSGSECTAELGGGGCPRKTRYPVLN